MLDLLQWRGYTRMPARALYVAVFISKATEAGYRAAVQPLDGSVVRKRETTDTVPGCGRARARETKLPVARTRRPGSRAAGTAGRSIRAGHRRASAQVLRPDCRGRAAR